MKQQKKRISIQRRASAHSFFQSLSSQPPPTTDDSGSNSQRREYSKQRLLKIFRLHASLAKSRRHVDNDCNTFERGIRYYFMVHMNLTEGWHTCTQQQSNEKKGGTKKKNELSVQYFIFKYLIEIEAWFCHKFLWFWVAEIIEMDI